MPATFHGRDVFAPVAARLAAEEPLAHAGEPLDPAEPVLVELPTARRDASALVAHRGEAATTMNIGLNDEVRLSPR